MSRETQENVQRLLDLTGVTHERLAEIAHLSRSAVTHWAAGKTVPRMGALQRVADYYGITTDNLVEKDGMKYVHACSDGRLREDVTAKMRDVRASIDAMDVNSFDPKVVAAFYRMLSSMPYVRGMSSDEEDLLRMYRALNARGRELVMSTVVAYVRSGMFSDAKE